MRKKLLFVIAPDNTPVRTLGNPHLNGLCNTNRQRSSSWYCSLVSVREL